MNCKTSVDIFAGHQDRSYRVQDKLVMESKHEIVVWAVRNEMLDGEEGQEAVGPGG